MKAVSVPIRFLSQSYWLRDFLIFLTLSISIHLCIRTYLSKQNEEKRELVETKRNFFLSLTWMEYECLKELWLLGIKVIAFSTHFTVHKPTSIKVILRAQFIN